MVEFHPDSIKAEGLICAETESRTDIRGWPYLGYTGHLLQ